MVTEEFKEEVRNNIVGIVDKMLRVPHTLDIRMENGKVAELRILKQEE